MTDNPIRTMVDGIKSSTGFTIADIADHIGVHPVTLQKAMAGGPLSKPARRLLWMIAHGHGWAVDLAAINAP